ncbi:MAG: hypothetical protein WC107_01340 [Patescibacteria group bacterium]
MRNQQKIRITETNEKASVMAAKDISVATFTRKPIILDDKFSIQACKTSWSDRF